MNPFHFYVNAFGKLELKRVLSDLDEETFGLP